jgi:hypothetical protein
MPEVSPAELEPIVEVDTVIAPEAPESEPEAVLEPIVEPVQPQKVHPLQPGGKRFEQVYAESKQNKRELDAERERRIAAEAQLAVFQKPTLPTTEPEYSWQQLEEFIAQGRITRADAEAHREEVNIRKLSSKIKQDFTQETAIANKSQALSASIANYVAAAPAALVVGSPERERLDQEFDWLVSVSGNDANNLTDLQRKVLQVTALRNVYGPIDSLVKRTTQTTPASQQGLPGGTPPRRQQNPDQALLDGLTKQQIEHYKRMFESGRYPGKWKDVVTELKWSKVNRQPVKR